MDKPTKCDIPKLGAEMLRLAVGVEQLATPDEVLDALDASRWGVPTPRTWRLPLVPRTRTRDRRPFKGPIPYFPGEKHTEWETTVE